MTNHLKAFAVSALLLCSFTAASAGEITVSAAMSLKGAFEEIGKLYERKHPGMKVRFNFGASGDLARQIAGGAPIDVFASAAPKDMDAVAAKGLIAPSTRANFIGNSWCWSPRSGDRESHHSPILHRRR